MADTKQSRFDSLKLGAILGLVVPAIAFLVFYVLNFSKVPFSFFVKYATQIAAVSKILSLSLLPNLVVFFIYLRKDYYLTARGILMSTIIWTFAIVFIKFIAE
jgi:hypothetical protein